MGFLDSILKKKKTETEEEVEPQAEPVQPVGRPPSPLKAKLMRVVSHSEKIILGLVLVVVTVLSVMKLLSAKGESSEISKTDTSVILGGEILDFQNERPTNLINLMKKAKEEPDAINLQGSNHLVFNPQVWKELFKRETGETLLIVDSPDQPLGISALKMTAIRTNTARLIARTFLGAGTVRHEFVWEDTSYPVMPYIMMGRNPLKTFYPQRSMPTNMLAVRSVGWLPDTNKVRSLHGFQGKSAGYLRFSPDWEFRVLFKAHSPVTPAQYAQAVRHPQRTVNGVVYDLDIIMGTKGRMYPYETNSIRCLSGVPFPMVRGYEADFAYKTKFHKRLEMKKFREGRHLMIDGEIFKLFKLATDKATLISDPVYGGNGKIYEKMLEPEEAQMANPQAVP